MRLRLSTATARRTAQNRIIRLVALTMVLPLAASYVSEPRRSRGVGASPNRAPHPPPVRLWLPSTPRPFGWSSCHPRVVVEQGPPRAQPAAPVIEASCGLGWHAADRPHRPALLGCSAAQSSRSKSRNNQCYRRPPGWIALEQAAKAY